MDYNFINLIIQAFIAIGTVGALFAALHQIRKNKAQHDQERAERIESKTRAQADNVAAWFGDGVLPGHDMGSMGSYVPKEAVVRNGSLLPVYNVIVSVVGVQGAGPLGHGKKTRATTRAAFFSARFCRAHGEL